MPTILIHEQPYELDYEGSCVCERETRREVIVF